MLVACRYVCTCVCESAHFYEQRPEENTEGSLVSCSIILHYSLETGSLSELGSRLTSSKLQQFLCPRSPRTCVSLGYVFTWVLHVQMRVFMLARQAQVCTFKSTTLVFPVRWKEPSLPPGCGMRGDPLCNAGTRRMSEASGCGVSPSPVSSHLGFYVLGYWGS